MNDCTVGANTKDAARRMEPTGTKTLTGFTPMRSRKMIGLAAAIIMSICGPHASIGHAMFSTSQPQPVTTRVPAWTESRCT